MITEEYPLTRQEVDALRNYLIGDSRSGMIGGSTDFFNCKTDSREYSVILKHSKNENSVAVAIISPKGGELEKIIRMLKVKARETNVLVGEK